MPNMPWVQGGDVEEIVGAIQGGDLQWHNGRATDGFFLPNAFEVPAHQHIIFNALQTAIEKEPDWNYYLQKLRAVSKIVGHKACKARLLETCYKGAPAADRAQVEKYRYTHIDWRWEELEETVVGLSGVLPSFRKYWDKAVFGTTKESATVHGVCHLLFI